MGTQQRKMKAGFSQAPKVHIKKFFSQARKQVNAAKGLKKKTGSRLYVKGVVASFKRSQAKQYNHTNLIKIQGVETTKDAEFYYGKKIMYVYRAHNTKDVKDEKGESSSTRFRVMWGNKRLRKQISLSDIDDKIDHLFQGIIEALELDENYEAE